MHTKLFKELHTAFALYENPHRAQQQQAYMKSSMPFWGIAKPHADSLGKKFFSHHPPSNNQEYRETIEYFFMQACHREEWYAGLTYAMMFKKHVTAENIDLYLWINRTCQWWDIVDTVSVHLIGKSLCKNSALSDYLTQWIQDENMWIRRTALITQLMYKSETDATLLAKLIEKTMHEKDFFIRKAIGWALRQYSKSNPIFVREFIHIYGNRLSNLSRKEGSKYLTRLNID